MQDSVDKASLRAVASVSQMRGDYLEVIQSPQATLVGKAYGAGSWPHRWSSFVLIPQQALDHGSAQAPRVTAPE